MLIPNIPVGNFLEKDSEGKPTGDMTAQWRNWFQQLFVALQKNLSNEGYFIPQQPSANLIGPDAKLNNENSTSALVYNSTTNTLMINLNGVFKTIQVGTPN